MDNIKLLEQLLKQYPYINLRMQHLERLMTNNSTEESTAKDSKYIHGNCLISNSVSVEQDKIITIAVNKLSNIKHELNNTKYIYRMLEDFMNLLKMTDKKSYTVMEKHYIHKVRMEDIADILYISRSRCYEIRKNAIFKMSKYVFGD